MEPLNEEEVLAFVEYLNGLEKTQIEKDGKLLTFYYFMDGWSFTPNTMLIYWDANIRKKVG